MKHNQKGISHLLVPLLIILVAAVAGTFYMVSSKADQVGAAPTLASVADRIPDSQAIESSPIKNGTSSGSNAKASGIRTLTLNVKGIQLVKCSKSSPEILSPNKGAPTEGKYYDYSCIGDKAGKVRKSDADLIVKLSNYNTNIPSTTCNGFSISKGTIYNFHNTRKLKCKLPGNAQILVYLRGTAEFHYGSHGKKYAWPYVKIGMWGSEPYIITNNDDHFVNPNSGKGIVINQSANLKRGTVHLGSIY